MGLPRPTGGQTFLSAQSDFDSDWPPQSRRDAARSVIGLPIPFFCVTASLRAIFVLSFPRTGRLAPCRYDAPARSEAQRLTAVGCEPSGTYDRKPIAGRARPEKARSTTKSQRTRSMTTLERRPSSCSSFLRGLSCGFPSPRAICLPVSVCRLPQQGNRETDETHERNTGSRQEEPRFQELFLRPPRCEGSRAAESSGPASIARISPQVINRSDPVWVWVRFVGVTLARLGMLEAYPSRISSILAASPFRLPDASANVSGLASSLRPAGAEVPSLDYESA